MVFKLGQLQSMVNALEGILTQRLPVKAAYWLGKFLTKATAEFKDFDASRVRLCEQYCRKDSKLQPIKMVEGEGGVWVEAKEDYEGLYRYAFTPEADVTVNKEFQELAGTEVTFDFKPLTLDQLGDKLEATAVEMAALQGLIVDEPPA
jgi:hypothetical protein